MTTQDLVALIAASFAQQPQRRSGGYLVCHTPHVAEFAYLGRLYDPVSLQHANDWASDTHWLRHPYLSFLAEVANGLRIANIDLGGVIEQVDRSVGPDVGQPISLDYGNVIERPTDLDDHDLVIGGIVGWSSRGAYVMDRHGAVRLVHYSNGADVADEWPSLETMLRAELTRIAALHDSTGLQLGSSTDLMHPNGRRWETELEPGTTRH